MFSKVYFLKLWLPFAVITLFTTSLTVYSIALFLSWGLVLALGLMGTQILV
jgi:hypothetical protein